MPNLPAVVLVWEGAQGETCLFYRALGFASGVGSAWKCEEPLWGHVHPPLQETKGWVSFWKVEVLKVQALVAAGKGGNCVQQEETVCVQQKET